MGILRRKSSSSSQPRRRMVSTDESPQENTNARVFARNRTLTGSSSSRITSSGEMHAHLKSPRVHVHHLAAMRRRAGSLLVGALVVSGLLFFLISQYSAQVTVAGRGVTNDASMTTTYEPLIQEYFARRPFERFRFATDMKEMVRFMQQNGAPEVVSLTLEPTADIAVSQAVLSLREPVAGWVVAGKQEYVDKTGTAFARNYYETPGVQIVDNSGVPITDGRTLASSRYLGFVGRLVGALNQQGYNVEQVIIPPSTTRQIELRIKGIGYVIKCSSDRSAGEQAEDIGRVIRYLEQRKVAPQYIDVRISNKAFYR